MYFFRGLINHWVLVLFLSMFVFLKTMYSQNDETGILEVGSTNQNFLYCPIMMFRVLENLFKFFQWILQFGSGISVVFLKTKKLKII